MNPIFTLIRKGDRRELEKQLSADPLLANLPDEQGLSPLLYACYQHNPSLVEILVAAGAKQDVFTATATGDLSVLSRLFEANHKEFSPDGWHLLHLAASFGQTEILEFLLKQGLDVNIVSRNHQAYTPLQSACASNHTATARILLNAGASVFPVTSKIPPLAFALFNKNEELCLLLIKQGSPIDFTLSDGYTLLHYAREWNNPAVLQAFGIKRKNPTILLNR